MFTSLHGLSTEEKLLLSKARPSTLAAAKRIQGITPVAILELIRYTKKSRPRNVVGYRGEMEAAGLNISNNS